MKQMAVFNTSARKELHFKELESFTRGEEGSVGDISFAPLTTKPSHSERQSVRGTYIVRDEYGHRKCLEDKSQDIGLCS